MSVDNYTQYVPIPRKKGDRGEDIAIQILNTYGFVLIERNYLTKRGEIDIIALKKGVIHFIEVKTTFGEYNPAENFHKTKLTRFLKTVQIYCYLNKISEELIEIDLALVDMKHRRFTLVRHANLYFH